MLPHTHVLESDDFKIGKIGIIISEKSAVVGHIAKSSSFSIHSANSFSFKKIVLTTGLNKMYAQMSFLD